MSPTPTSETDSGTSSFTDNNDTTKYTESQIAPLQSSNNIICKKQ